MNWKQIVKGIAPVIGTALGGPLGGGAARYLAGALLGDENASEEDLENAILGATPEQLARIREIDNQYKIEMARAGVDVFKLEVADRSSARELAKNDIRPHLLLSGIYTVGYFWLLWALVTGTATIAEGTEQLVITVVGVLTAAQIQIMNFWFGSSSGSKEKTYALASVDKVAK